MNRTKNATPGRPVDGARPDSGFTLAEMMVSVIILAVVTTMVAATLIQGLRMDRENASTIRAQGIAEDLLAQMAQVPAEQLAHYRDDPINGVWALNPSFVYGRCPYTDQSLIDSICGQYGVAPQQMYSVRDTSRPSTNPAIPPTSQTIALNDTAADRSAGLVTRKYTVSYRIFIDYRRTDNGETDTSASLATTKTEYIETQPKTVVVSVRWRDGDKPREFHTQRTFSPTGTNCNARVGLGAGYSAGDETGAKVDVCMSVITDTSAAATGDRGAIGPFSLGKMGTRSNPAVTDVPSVMTRVNVSGTSFQTAGAVKVRAQPVAATYFAASGSLISRRPTSMTAVISNGDGAGGSDTALQSYPMTENAARGVWEVTIPSGTTLPGNATSDVWPNRWKMRVDAVFSNGSTISSADTQMTPTVPVAAANQMFHLKGLTSANAAQALPKAVGTPTGSLRLNTTPTTRSLEGTVTPRLCTKSDGTLWFNQKFYFQMVNGSPAMQNGSTNWWQGTTTASISGFTASSTLTSKTPKMWVKPAEGIDVVSGSVATRQALSTTRWQISFPTAAAAAASTVLTQRYAGAGTDVPRFFSRSVSVTIEADRNVDGSGLRQSITIPVYRSTTGTSTDCISGTAAQPTY